MTSWRESAGRFAENERKFSLSPPVQGFIDKLPGDQPLLVACSAGADSVYLTLVLHAALSRSGRRLELVHFNHGTRGADAEGDADFVADMATGLAIPFHLGHPDAPLARDEASLRDARYAWMVRLYHERQAGGLFLGHHADDVIESQLMAVLTGSGPVGLASPQAIKVFSDGHVRLRPLLGDRRSEITDSLKRADVPWREDQSNQDPGYLRNWLRIECIPRLRERVPQDIYSGTQRTHQLMEECQAALDAAVAERSLEFTKPDCLDAGQLIGQPRAVIRRAFMTWWMWHRSGQTIGGGAVDTVVDMLEQGRFGDSCAAGQGQILLLDATGKLRLACPQPEEGTEWPAEAHWCWGCGPLYLPDGSCLRAERVDWAQTAEPPYSSADPQRTAWLAMDQPTLHVRQWKSGDRYQPLGAPGSRKLQDLFVDAKVRVEQKRRLPVITDNNGQILWVPGFPPAHAFRIIAGSNSGLKLTYQPQ